MEYTGEGSIIISGNAYASYNLNFECKLSSSYSLISPNEFDFSKSFTTNWDIISNEYYWWKIVGSCRINSCPADQIQLNVNEDSTCSRIGYLSNNNIELYGQAEIFKNFEPVPDVIETDSPVVLNQNEKCNELFQKTIYDPNRISRSNLSVVTNVLARSIKDVCDILKNPKLGPPLENFKIVSIQRYKNPIGTPGGVTSELIEQDFCNIPECFDYCLDFDFSPSQNNLCNPTINLNMFVFSVNYYEFSLNLSLSGSAEVFVVFSSEFLGPGSLSLLPSDPSFFSRILFLSKAYINITGSAEIFSSYYFYDSNNILNISNSILDFFTYPIFSQGKISLSNDLIVNSEFWNYDSNLLLDLKSYNEYKLFLKQDQIVDLEINNQLDFNYTPKYYHESSGSVDIFGEAYYISNYYNYLGEGLVDLDSDELIYNEYHNPWVKIGDEIYGETVEGYSGSVSISGDANILAIGEYGYVKTLEGTFGSGLNMLGSVRVFQNNEDSWVQMGESLYGIDQFAHFGQSLSLSIDGTKIIVGAPLEGAGRGRVRIYEWNGSSWNQVGSDIAGDAPGDNFGISVSMNSFGDVVSIGSNNDYVKIYQWDGSDWQQMGTTIVGNSGDLLGSSLKLTKEENRIVIGAPNYDSNRGYVKVFDWDGSDWNQYGETLYGKNTGDFFGSATSINYDGNIIAIASWNYIKINRYDGLSWNGVYSEQEILPGDFDNFILPDLDMNYLGDIISIGAGSSDFYGSNSGRVITYKLDNFDDIDGNWNLLGNKINGEIGTYTGQSISISDDGYYIAVGSPYDDSNGIDSGKTSVYNYIGIIWSYDSLNLLDISGSNQRLGLYNIVSDNQNIFISGESDDYYYNNLFSSSGEIIVGGEALFSSASSDYKYSARGNILLDGEAITNFVYLPGFDINKLVSSFYLYSNYSDFSVSFLDSSLESTLSEDTSRINVCGCENLSKNLSIAQNLINAGVFSDFIQSNSITFDSVTKLVYKQKSNSWNNIFHYKNNDNNIFWTIIFDLSCTNLVNGQETDVFYYKFVFDAKYQNQSSVLRTKISVNIDSNDICQNNNLYSKITIDTANGGILVNGSYVNYYSLIDKIGLFSNDYWNNKLSYENVRSGRSNAPFITGIFPEFIINDTQVTTNNNDGYVKINL